MMIIINNYTIMKHWFYEIFKSALHKKEANEVKQRSIKNIKCAKNAQI